MNYGFEIELFGANLKNKQIFNATKLIFNHLKLDELPGFPDRGENPLLASTPRFDLIADGTPFEIISKKTACEHSMLDKDGLAVRVLNKHLLGIQVYLNRLFNIDTLLVPFVQNNEWDFIKPGKVFTSNKRIHNAYTNASFYNEKKEENDLLVTFRSAGFHIHIRFEEKVEKEIFKDIYAPKQCNELVKELDSVYKKYLPHSLSLISPALVEKESARNEKYATFGNYRIKYHSQGFSTLEYRQFSAAFFLLPLDVQTNILHDFASTVRKFVNKIKKQSP